MQNQLNYLMDFLKALGFAYVSFWYVILLFSLCGGVLARLLGYERRHCIRAALLPGLLPFALLLAVFPGMISELLGTVVLLLIHFGLCWLFLRHPNPGKMYMYFLLSSAVFGVIWLVT